MEMFGVKGFPEDATVPTLVSHVYSETSERAVGLVKQLPEAEGLRLQAIHIGGGQPPERVAREMPWAWPDKAA